MQTCKLRRANEKEKKKKGVNLLMNLEKFESDEKTAYNFAHAPSVLFLLESRKYAHTNISAYRQDLLCLCKRHSKLHYLICLSYIQFEFK